MSQNYYQEVSNYFGINTVKELIHNRFQKFMISYGAADNYLCRLIFAKCWTYSDCIVHIFCFFSWLPFWRWNKVIYCPDTHTHTHTTRWLASLVWSGQVVGLANQWSRMSSIPAAVHYRSVGTGMGDRFRAGISPRYVTSHPDQLSLLLSVGREMSTGHSAVMLYGCREKRQDGSFHSWINMWVASKTLWSLVNTCYSCRRALEASFIIKRCTNLRFFFNVAMSQSSKMRTVTKGFDFRPTNRLFLLWRSTLSPERQSARKSQTENGRLSSLTSNP